MALLLTAMLLPCGAPASIRPDESLAKFVPADVGLFAEVHGAADLLTMLSEPRIWTTLAEVAGQPSQPEDAEIWRQRIRQTVKMDPDQAIRVLFSRAVAFIGEGPGRAQDAVVLCRPAADVPTRQLLKDWNAQRLPKPRRPATYRLHSNIGVAEHEGLLFFGDLLPPKGLFYRMQRFASTPGAPALGDDPVYQKLRARVPAKADGILFARLGQAAPLLVPAMPAALQPATQPATRPAITNLPGPLRNAENVMIALHREGALLHFTAVGDANGKTEGSPASPLKLIATLPQRTLAAWEGRVDLSAVSQAVEQLPERNVVRIAFKLQEQTDLLNRFFQALDTDACVAVGTVFPQQRAADAPPMPAIALLAATRDAAAVTEGLKNVVDACAGSYALYALARSVPPLPPVQQVSIGGTPVSLINLGPLLKPTAKAAIGEVHFCWTVHDDVLIVASHLDWLGQIIDARAGRAATFSQVVQLSRGKLATASTCAITLQTGPIADLGQHWLNYLKRTKPEVFDESWWRERQPNGGNIRLGIDVKADQRNRRLRIERVFKKHPADGHLEVGDFIVGYGNRRFASNDLFAEVRTAIQERPRARRLDLLVERNGVTRQVWVPLPFFDPIEALERIIAIGKMAQRAVYHDDQSDPSGLRGFLTIELRQSDEPLFDFAAPRPPASAPATPG